MMGMNLVCFILGLTPSKISAIGEFLEVVLVFGNHVGRFH